jgi:hypothetical protein
MTQADGTDSHIQAAPRADRGYTLGSENAGGPRTPEDDA